MAKDPALLEELLAPVAAVRGDIDSITIIDENGIELLTLGKDPNTQQLLKNYGGDFSALDLTQQILAGTSDAQGDKYVGLLTTSYGPTLVTGAPVYGPNGDVVGGVMVGSQLQKLLNGIKAQDLALSDLVVFDPARQKIIATTLVPPDEGFSSLINEVQQISGAELEKTHPLKLYNRDFQMTLTELMVRQDQLGWLGVILPSSYVVAAEATSRNVLVLIFAIGTVATVLVGYLISQSIARPILKLRSLTQAVASGDLNQTSGFNRSDEIGELADTFDVMTSKLPRTDRRGQSPVRRSDPAQY